MSDLKMQDYLIQSQHEVFENSYNEGEGKEVQSYSLEGKIQATNIEEALKMYYAERWSFCI